MLSSRKSFFSVLNVVLSLSNFGSAAIGPVADLVIANAQVSPDGFTRSATLANGVLDRTIISGNTGDQFKINVINNLNDSTQYQSTTIHWHGLFQKGNAWADGPAFVTQCPIIQNNSFLYTFTADGQAGTFWYHSHLATQYCDGLRSPLIIYDPKDPYLSDYDVDDDTTVLTISDWYHIVSKKEGVGPTPDSILINGLGRWTGDTTAPLAVVTVTKGVRYRFRLVNIGCDPNYIFSIDGHTFTVIEADGVNTKPYVVDSIQIYVGQRYSFILNANQTIDNYFIRAQPNRAAQTNFTNGLNTAILRYVGAPIQDPTTTSNLSNPLVEASMVPLNASPAPGKPTPGGADVVLNIAITFVAGAFEINGVSFVPPTVPVLLQILSGAQSPSTIMPKGSIYNIEQGDVVELTIPGGTPGAPHPFHLHGHTFYVVRSANQSTPNYVNPPQRDVVNTGVAGDNVTIRFVADNPGPWFLHCHIDWHLNEGLAIVFAETPEQWNATINPPPAWDDLCPIYDNTPSSDL